MTVVRIPQQDSAELAFNKLARTFAAQVETLKRYRGGGEQNDAASRCDGSRWRLDGGSSRLDLTTLLLTRSTSVLHAAS
jgi:hypothetical protein